MPRAVAAIACATLVTAAGAMPAIAGEPVTIEAVRMSPDPLSGTDRAIFRVVNDAAHPLTVTAWCYFFGPGGEPITRAPDLLVAIPPGWAVVGEANAGETGATDVRCHVSRAERAE